jgi:3'-5' exoribonuclease
MEQDLRELIATVQSPHLGTLLERMLGRGTETWARFREAPAAKRYHHAYRHGLLDHSLTVAQAVSALSAIFGGVHRDVALTGALLHDIGKLDAYRRVGEEIEMSDAGRLHGEIPLGYSRVRDEIAQIEGFPFELCQAILHIILSHHGTLEHGSPVVPCTREATLVHMADNLGSKLGSFDRVERALDAGAQWATYDNGIGAVAYFGTDGAEPQSARLAA